MSLDFSTKTQPAVLSLDGVSKRFGGTQAVAGVGFCVGPGEIVALLGENGAGKSTLIKMLAGIHKADSGNFKFCGTPFDPERAHPKIAFIHQDLGLIEWMTVAENISLMQNSYPRRFGLIDWAATDKKALNALAIVSDVIDPDSRVQDLTRTEKSLVAIARALARNAELLVLDEPTASLPQSEVELLHDALRTLRNKGVAMIYVSHRLDEVFQIADRVVVLRDGLLVADEDIANLDGDRLVHLIIGRELDEVFIHPPAPDNSTTILSLHNLETEGVGPVSLELRKGEIVGLVGLRGAGHDAIGHALFGRSQVLSGQITLEDGAPLVTSHPRDSINQGICMVPGDRNAESIAPGMSIQENLFLNPKLGGRGIFSFQKPSTETRCALEIGQRFDIRPNDPAAPIETLSGGNQQKVVMARWLSVVGSILVLEDPTAGVDVGSKADIYALLSQALSTGLGVLLISADFEEISSICHRAHVFHQGRIISEIAGKNLSVQSLLNAASLEPTALNYQE